MCPQRIHPHYPHLLPARINRASNQQRYRPTRQLTPRHGRRPGSQPHNRDYNLQLSPRASPPFSLLGSPRVARAHPARSPLVIQAYFPMHVPARSPPCSHRPSHRPSPRSSRSAVHRRSHPRVLAFARPTNRLCNQLVSPATPPRLTLPPSSLLRLPRPLSPRRVHHSRWWKNKYRCRSLVLQYLLSRLP